MSEPRYISAEQLQKLTALEWRFRDEMRSRQDRLTKLWQASGTESDDMRAAQAEVEALWDDFNHVARRIVDGPEV